jgi:hypothetical protein
MIFRYNTPEIRINTMNFLDIQYEPKRFLYAAIGDVHGDLGSLTAAVDIVRVRAAAKGRTAAVVLLGDLIDRGADSAGCAAFAMRLARGLDPERPDVRVLLVRGDHEDALSHDAGTDSFSSDVVPCEWCERLAGLPPDDPERALAWEFVAFAHDAPAAIRFSSGILCAHGGVPHADLLPRLVTAADLCAPECARDFLWCRVSDARRKFPNRSARDCELGRDDIVGFLGRLDQLPAAEGFPVSPVRLFVRGHDHARDGHASMSLGEGHGTVHTVTTFRDEEDDFFGPQRATLLILPDDPASGEPEIVPVPEKEDRP